jgi:hypothetical protein
MDEVTAFPACLQMPLMIEPEHQLSYKRLMQLEQATQQDHAHHSIETTSVPWTILVS